MMIAYLIISLSYAVPILIAVAFLTLVERNVLSYIQARNGPNIVGPFGLLQPVADGVNLFINESIHPSSSSPILFIITPILALLLAITIWIPLPLPFSLADLNLGLLVFWESSVLHLGSDSQIHFHPQLGQLGSGGCYENTIRPQNPHNNLNQASLSHLNIDNLTCEHFDRCHESVQMLEMEIGMSFCLLSMESPSQPCAVCISKLPDSSSGSSNAESIYSSMLLIGNVFASV